LFTMRCGPLSFWFVQPAILPSPPFLSLLSLVVSSLRVSLCTVVVALFFRCCCCVRRLPSDKFSLVPVKTGSLLVSHVGSPWFLLISCVVVVVVVVIVSATWCCNSSSRGAPFLNFAGPRPARRAGSIQPLISEGTPLEKHSAGPPEAPLRDPRASPDHPTWWLVPPGASQGQVGEKTAQFGPWVLPPNRIA
jgi:hypothetical protein